MSSSQSTRTTASGRTYPQHFYRDSFRGEIGQQTPGGLQFGFEQITKVAQEYGYDSIFHAALALAEHQVRTSTRQLVEFAQDGGLSRFIKAACRKKVIKSIRSLDTRTQYNAAICDAAGLVFKEEWRRFMELDGIRKKLTDFSLEHVESFAVEALYLKWRSTAPNLFALMECMGMGQGWKDSTIPSTESAVSTFGMDEEGKKKYRRRCRYIIMAVSIMGSLSSQKINLLQGLFGYFLYSCRVPKRAITILHKWGIAVAYSSLNAAVRSMGKLLRADLQQLGRKNVAFQVVFDNCTASASVRDETLHNKSDFLKYTVGYVIEPTIPRPMFERSHVDYSKVASLTVAEFIPSVDDTATLRSIFRHFIATTIRSFCHKRNVTLPTLDFSMPSVKRLDHKSQPKIHVLPTYDLDESHMDDMIEILYRIGEDVGLSDTQIEENVVAYGGDFFTTITERRAKARQVECSPNKQLNYIEATIGLFHLEIAVLVMLFRSHGGLEKEVGTLSYWIKLLQRNKNTLWDGRKQLVKDFRGCYELFGQIVDGYLLGFIAERCGWKEGRLETAFEEHRDTLQQRITDLVEDLSNFKDIHSRRQNHPSDRDLMYENMILFLQHGLILRNFHHAMKHGDIGRILISFRHMTCWFQSTKQFNYAHETIHLTACLERIWSPAFKRFMLNHSLISITGKSDSFYACDELNEYVVREVKKMMVHNATAQTDQHLREVISPQVLFNMQLKMKMAEESNATYIFDYHHQNVDTSSDLESIAKECLRRKAFRPLSGRGTVRAQGALQKEVPDLLMAGLRELSNTKRLAEYKEKVVAMGIRGVVELQRQSAIRSMADEQGGGQEEEEAEEDDVPIETELFGGLGDDRDETWLGQ